MSNPATNPVQAAYQCGYDATLLADEHRRYWDYHQKIRDREIEADWRLPQRIDSLEVSLRALIDPAAEQQHLITQAIVMTEDARRAFQRLLDVLQDSFQPQDDIDWEALNAPGYDRWLWLITSLDSYFDGDGRLEPWWDLGCDLANFTQHSLGAVYPADPLTKDLANQIKVMKAMTGADFLQYVAEVLAGLITADHRAESVQCFIDPARSRVDCRLLDPFIRRELAVWKGVKPCLVITPGEVIFFGKSWPITAFPETELAILRCLARKPGKEVLRSEIRKVKNCNRELKELPTRINGLRKLIRPAVEEYFSHLEQKPKHDEKCFIVGVRKRGGNGGYKLTLSSEQVRVED